MNRLVIRQALEIDIDPLIILCTASLMTSFGELVDAETLLPWSEGNDIEKYVKGMWPNMLVAVDGPDLVGVLALNNHRIDIIWVDPSHRERGVGGQLMDVAEDSVSDHHGSIEVDCLKPDVNAIQFYENRGYTQQKTYIDQFSGISKVVMYKSLASV